MRLIKLFTAVTAALLVAGLAQAELVNTSSGDQTEGILVGDTFSVNIDIDYTDDQSPPDLTGIFVSASWDPTVIQLDSAESPGFFILGPGARGFLSKLSDPFNAAGDPEGTIRAVSYGASPGQFANAGVAPATTTLVFTAIGLGDTSVDVLFQQGDEITSGAGSSTDPGFLGAGVAVSVIPEPGTALLMGLGLAGLAGAGRRQR